MIASRCHRVEHCDTDASGVMHFARYTSLAESSLLDAFEALDLSLPTLEGQGFSLVVHALQAEYFLPARFGYELRLAPHLKPLSPVRIDGRSTVHCQLDGDEVELAKVVLQFVVVSTTTGRAAPLPKHLLDRIQRESP